MAEWLFDLFDEGPMIKQEFKRIPRHIGVIPDGNRRWAVSNGMDKSEGYHHGLSPGFKLYELCVELGSRLIIRFTVDNTKRLRRKGLSREACVEALKELANRDAELRGRKHRICNFPVELLPYTRRVKFGDGKLSKFSRQLRLGRFKTERRPLQRHLPIDLISAGEDGELSGFLPIQSVYADIFVLDELWPDFQTAHFYRALEWYQSQDITLGG